jgi:polysaccharide biosynthesis protein PslJ
MTPVLPRAGRAPSLSSLVVGVLLLLVMAATVAAAKTGLPKLAGLALGATLVLIWVQLWWSWRSLITLLLGVIWFIPIKRYGFPFHLPFDVEPYRILVAFLVLVWIAALLIDRRVRLRAGKIDFAVFAFFFVVLVSDAANFRYIESQNIQIDVLKSLSFFFSFVLVYLIIVSITRTRDDLQFFVKILVAGGAIVGAAAIIEYRTRYNIFDHLTKVFPFLSFSGPLDATRAGNLRVYASAQHPIAFSAAMVMLIPLAVYLARSSRGYRWWVAFVLIGMGAAASLSRTGVTMFVAAFVVFWRYRPADTRRLLPVLLLGGVVVFLALPHVLGTLSTSLFPAGGLLAEQRQSGNFVGGHKLGRLATLGPGLHQWEKHPALGTGFGSRILNADDPTHVNANIQDDQWLDQLQETGVVGVFVLIWLFVRSTRLLGRLARVDDRDGLLAGALAASLVAFFVGMFTFDAFSFIQVTFLFFIVLAFGTSLLRLAGIQELPVVSATGGPKGIRRAGSWR